MYRPLLLVIFSVSAASAWPCSRDEPLTPECAELETERVTTAYLKAALDLDFLDSLEADPSPAARLVRSILLALPPDFDQVPNASPTKEALARADRALLELLDDHPDFLPARIVALDRCEQRCDPCPLEQGTALRRYFPDNAFGYLVLAHHQWTQDQPVAALELLQHTGAAEVYDLGIWALVRAAHDVLDRLPRDAVDDPFDQRDLALYDIGFGLAAALRVPYLVSIQEICLPTSDPAVIAACLAATRAMTLPGTNLRHSAIALAIERAIHDSVGDEQNLERVITETALLQECAESVSLAEWSRDPALKAAFVKDLERHGECRALQLQRPH